MATTTLSKTGLQKQDKGDKDWQTALNTGFDNLESRIGKTNAGDPNGSVSAEWVGQTCQDTSNGHLYIAITTGSAANAVWSDLGQLLPNDSVSGNAVSGGTIDGSVSILAAQGSAANPSIARDGDTNTGIFWPSTNTLGIATGGAQRVTVDDSGNVGIAVTSPVNRLDIGGRASIRDSIIVGGTQSVGYTSLNDITVRSDGNSGILLEAGDTAFSRYAFGNSSNLAGYIEYNHAADYMKIYVNDSERVRFDSSGNLLVATTSTTIDSSNFGFKLNGSFRGKVEASTNLSGAQAAHIFYGNAGEVQIRGDGDLVNTNGNYGTISDPRLKQDVSPVSSQWDDVKELGSRFVNYRLKDAVERQGDDAPTLLSVLADDDFAARFPGLTKTDAETGYRNFKQSVASMKGLVALSEALERIEALEARLG